MHSLKIQQATRGTIMGDNNDQGGGGGFILGLLMGSAVGAVVALLYAPQRGDDTRVQLAQKSSEYAETAKAKTSEIADTIRQNAGDYTGKASGVVDTLKTKSNEVAGQVAGKTAEVLATAKGTATNLAFQGKAFVDAKTTQVTEAVNAGKDGYSDKKQELQGTAAGDDSEAAA